MTSLAPITREGNRGNVLSNPPYKYDASTWLKSFVGPLQRDLSIFMARLLVDVTAKRLFGPLEIPIVSGDRAIIGAYAHPFIWGNVDTSGQDPTAGDNYVVRPVFSIRGPRDIEVQLTMMDLSTASQLTGNTGVEPIIEGVSMERMAGDFYVSADLSGADETDQTNAVTIIDVQDDGADPDMAGYTIYQLQLNQGTRKKVSISDLSAAPVVGDPYPLSQPAGRFDYEVGEFQQEQDHLYPKRNVREVESLSPEVQGNADRSDQSNPYAIQSVHRILDLPDNPTTYVKKCTLVNGMTIKVADSIDTVLGEEIGDTTTTGSLQASQDVSKWVAFDCLIVTAPSRGDDNLGGIAVDPWPLFV